MWCGVHAWGCVRVGLVCGACLLRERHATWVDLQLGAGLCDGIARGSVVFERRARCSGFGRRGSEAELHTQFLCLGSGGSMLPRSRPLVLLIRSASILLDAHGLWCHRGLGRQ